MSEDEGEEPRDNAGERARVEAYFTDDNLRGAEEVVSPSGRFRLVIRSYETRPGCWHYSRGTVYRIADGAEVCDIKRNYGNFHHTFVTRRGSEWLIAGRSYMSQTIVDLDAGREYEPDGDHYEGTAFCWAAAFLSPDGDTLAIDGCHWACPYEYKFFDFREPARGWPALAIRAEDPLEVEDYSGKLPPVWHDDGTFEYFGTHKDQLVARTRVRREGDAIVVVDRWVDPAEQERRAGEDD